MPKIYCSNSTNPYENIAIETEIFKRKEEALYLWVNEPSVIVGANQNVLNEVNLIELQRRNIHLVRRKSGGGTVYHDLGNLNFSFFSKELNKDFFLDIIIDALKSLGIEVFKSGRNDLIYKDQKISGTAYLMEDDFYLFHGTIMVDVDLNCLELLLNRRKIKYDLKGIESIKSRVVNLNDLRMIDLKNAIIQEYQKRFKQTSFEECVYDLKEVKRLMKKEWIYDDLKEERLHIEKRINDEVYDFYLEIKENKIVDLEVYSDGLNIETPQKLKELLLNKTYYQFETYLKETDL